MKKPIVEVFIDSRNVTVKSENEVVKSTIEDDGFSTLDFGIPLQKDTNYEVIIKPLKKEKV